MGGIGRAEGFDFEWVGCCVDLSRGEGVSLGTREERKERDKEREGARKEREGVGKRTKGRWRVRDEQTGGKLRKTKKGGGGVQGIYRNKRSDRGRK